MADRNEKKSSYQRNRITPPEGCGTRALPERAGTDGRNIPESLQCYRGGRISDGSGRDHTHGKQERSPSLRNAQACATSGGTTFTVAFQPKKTSPSAHI